MVYVTLVKRQAMWGEPFKYEFLWLYAFVEGRSGVSDAPLCYTSLNGQNKWLLRRSVPLSFGVSATNLSCW